MSSSEFVVRLKGEGVDAAAGCAVVALSADIKMRPLRVKLPVLPRAQRLLPLFVTSSIPETHSMHRPRVRDE